MIIIFSYNRPNLLLGLLDELDRKFTNQRVVVIDDGSTYDPIPFVGHCEYYRLNHKGKEEFYLNWKYAFSICKDSSDDFFMFMPDDFKFVDSQRVKKIYQHLKDDLYVMNLLNDNRPPCWTPIKHIKTTIGDEAVTRVSFCDCGYFTNRKTLESIKFEQLYISMERFRITDISSGVGESQSRMFWKKNIPMYVCDKSLVYHGTHKSEMHTELRKRQPLTNQ